MTIAQPSKRASGLITVMACVLTPDEARTLAVDLVRMADAIDRSWRDTFENFEHRADAIVIDVSRAMDEQACR